MSEETLDSTFNKCLAKACMGAGSSCCCKGQIFLPNNELESIRTWLSTRSESERENFERCVVSHDGFALLNQENRCQFLDDKNLCRLHNEGVKPTECFWWPLHVYLNNRNQLEIRISEDCCGAHTCLNCDAAAATETEVLKIETKARLMGLDLIRQFRQVYQGSYVCRPMRVISE